MTLHVFFWSFSYKGYHLVRSYGNSYWCLIFLFYCDPDLIKDCMLYFVIQFCTMYELYLLNDK